MLPSGICVHTNTDLIFPLASFQISDDIINCQGGDMVAWGGNRRPSKIDIPCVVSIGKCVLFTQGAGREVDLPKKYTDIN